MKIEDLERISNHRNLSDHELLIQGAKGSIKLYTIIKNDFNISYDLVATHTCPDTGTEQITYYEEPGSTSYQRGQTIELPIPAIEELLLNNKLVGYTLNDAFPGATVHHKIRSLTGINDIELDDVYYYKKTANKTASNKSQRTPKPHIRAVQTALANLNNPSNEDIYNWIKNETNDPGTDCTFLYNLDFEGDGITPLSTAYEGDTVLKYNDKPVTKKNFQSICSREKNKN